MASYHTDAALARLRVAAQNPKEIDQAEADARYYVDHVEDPRHRQFFKDTFADIKDSRHSPEDLERIGNAIDRYQNKHWPNEQTESEKSAPSRQQTDQETNGQATSGRSGSGGRVPIDQSQEQAVTETRTSAQKVTSAHQQQGSEGRPRMGQLGERASADHTNTSEQNTKSAHQQRGSDDRPRMGQLGEQASPDRTNKSAQNTESADRQRGADGKIRLGQETSASERASKAESSQQEPSSTNSESTSRERNR